MSQFTKAILLVGIIYLASCSNSKSEPAKSDFQIESEKERELDSMSQIKAFDLAKKTKAITGWDTLERFTYYLQELVQADNRPISFEGEINDVSKRDSVYILKLHGTNIYATHEYIAEISVNPSVFQELRTQMQAKATNKGCFIFQVSNVTTCYPKLTSETNTDGPSIEEAYSYLTFSFDESLVRFEGSLQDFSLFEQLEKSRTFKY